MVEIFTGEQGSPEWHQMRCGVVTASRFKDVMAKGELKMRTKYMRELASEIVRGTVEMEGYTNAAMERGKSLEDEARDLYSFKRGVEPQQVCFMKSDKAGCSPDSLIGTDGGLEIKTALGHIQIERLQKGTLPSEHAAQVQGGLWVSGRDFWDFMSYSVGLPPLIIRVEPDREYIATMEAEIDKFNEELTTLVEFVKGYGK